MTSATVTTTPFLAEGKAVQAHTLSNGDLIIEGWAARFDGVDRQGENFAEGAFRRGIKSFLTSNPTLAFHHKHDHIIGSVLDLSEVPGEGLWMKARVDHQPESSPLRWIYNAVKRGTMRGLSVGGFFKRKLTEAGVRIADMDFTEISVTAVPVHPRTSFALVEGKAITDPVAGIDARMGRLEAAERRRQIQRSDLALLRAELAILKLDALSV